MGKDPATADTTIVFLLSKFDTKSSIERHTLKDILKEIGISAVKWIVHKLEYRGSDDEARALKQSLWVLGEIGGVVVVEVIFGYPGLGKYIYDAAIFGDYNAVEAAAMLTVTIAVATRLIGDLIYTFLNPRIRYA